MNKTTFHIFLFALTCAIASSCFTPAGAQYFVKRKIETSKESDPSEIKEKRQATSPFHKLFVKKPIKIIAKNKKNSAKKEQKTQEGQAGPIGKIEIAAFIEETFGKCTQKDKNFIDLAEIAMSEVDAQSDAFTQKNQESGIYDVLLDLDLEEVQKDYEKTKELPEELKPLMENQPTESMGTLATLIKSIDSQELVMASARCANINNALETTNIEKYLNNVIRSGELQSEAAKQ